MQRRRGRQHECLGQDVSVVRAGVRGGESVHAVGSAKPESEGHTEGLAEWTWIFESSLWPQSSERDRCGARVTTVIAILVRNGGGCR